MFKERFRFTDQPHRTIASDREEARHAEIRPCPPFYSRYCKENGDPRHPRVLSIGWVQKFVADFNRYHWKSCMVTPLIAHLWKSNVFTDHLRERLVCFDWIYDKRKILEIREDKLHLRRVTLYEFRADVTVGTTARKHSRSPSGSCMSNLNC